MSVHRDPAQNQRFHIHYQGGRRSTAIRRGGDFFRLRSLYLPTGHRTVCRSRRSAPPGRCIRSEKPERALSSPRFRCRKKGRSFTSGIAGAHGPCAVIVRLVHTSGELRCQTSKGLVERKVDLKVLPVADEEQDDQHYLGYIVQGDGAHCDPGFIPHVVTSAAGCGATGPRSPDRNRHNGYDYYKAHSNGPMSHPGSLPAGSWGGPVRAPSLFPPFAMFSVDLSDPLTLTLGGGRTYPIHFEPLVRIPALLASAGLRVGRCLIVTDTHVGALYASTLGEALTASGWIPRFHTIPAGEASKSMACLNPLLDAALSWGIDRKTPVLALGGGVVGDLAGFAAAILLRGLPFVQIPTSLIAQVDSAIGGKTGINHPSGKNLIGAFHQPAFVCCDPAMLGTLPGREWHSGLAEVVKHALIADPDFLAELERHWMDVLARRQDLLAPMVYRAAGIKAAIVSEDEREQGRRAVLNFGHTFGHALEQQAGYGYFTHGEAVALGMRAALYLSNCFHPSPAFARAEALVARVPLSRDLPPLPRPLLMQALRGDKKAEAGSPRFVLLREPGSAYVRDGVDPSLVEAAWDHIGVRSR